MNRFTMITEQLSKITVLDRAAMRRASLRRTSLEGVPLDGVPLDGALLRLARRLVLALMIGLTAIGVSYPTVANAATSSVPENVYSTGTDFWLTFMYNFGKDNDDVHLVLYAIPEEDADITVKDAAGNELHTESSVEAGTVFRYEVNRSKGYMTNSGVKAAKGIHVTSTKSITLYASNQYNSGSDFSYDQTPVVATPALGTEYVIQTYYRDMTNTEFAIVATEDGTTVGIDFSHNAKNSGAGGDFAKGNHYDFNLNAGEVYQFWGMNASKTGGYHHMSGTIVSSDKPIAVFTGGVKGSVPYVSGVNGDLLMEQNIPLSAWGKRFVAMEMSGFPEYEDLADAHSPTVYNITAIYDGTYVVVNGDTVKTLNSGQSYAPADEANPKNNDYLSVAYNESPKLIETSEPVLMFAYMVNSTSNIYDGNSYSEPSMTLIPDVTKGVKKAVIYCDPSLSMEWHYANVVVDADYKGSMLLNGSPVGDFVTLGSTFENHSTTYAYARVQLSSGVNVLENNDAPFVAVRYDVQTDNAISEAGATVFNLAPIAPKMFIDDNEVMYDEGKNYASFDYCNRHPGVHFTAIVDYPHKGVKWELGEDAESTDYEADHMYGATVGESDKEHNVKLYVYRESPISHIKDTDSIWVKLTVHPVYYDTLKTKVAANKMSYTWDGTSLVPFGLYEEDGVTPRYARFQFNKEKYDLAGRKPWIEYRKDSANAAAWTNNLADFQIFDSLEYATKHGCDSIFYLQLDVVPDVEIVVPNDTVCHHGAFEWTGHTPSAGHRMMRVNTTTNDTIYNGVPGKPSTADFFNTDVAGDYIFYDSIRSKTVPFVDATGKDNIDTIYILNLRVHPQPELELASVDLRYDTLCIESLTEAFIIPLVYDIDHCDSIGYTICDKGNPSSVYRTIAEANPTPPLNLPMHLERLDTLGLTAGSSYWVLMKTWNKFGCESEIDTVFIHIWPTPEITVSPIAAKCYPTASFTAAYTQTNADSIRYSVTNSAEEEMSGATGILHPTAATGELTINTTGWPAGVYTLHTGVLAVHKRADESKDECGGEEKHTTFEIKKKATAAIVHIDNQCDIALQTEVTYQTTDADTCYYYIKSQGKGSMKGVKKSNGEEGTFDLDISGLNCTGTEDLVDSLFMVAVSGCTSDTAKTEFTIYAMPTATISTPVEELNGCVPYMGVKTVNFSKSPNVTQIKWQLITPRATKDYDYYE